MISWLFIHSKHMSCWLHLWVLSIAEDESSGSWFRLQRLGNVPWHLWKGRLKQLTEPHKNVFHKQRLSITNTIYLALLTPPIFYIFYLLAFLSCNSLGAAVPWYRGCAGKGLSYCSRFSPIAGPSCALHAAVTTEDTTCDCVTVSHGTLSGKVDCLGIPIFMHT